MKLASYAIDGRRSFGVIEGDRILDLQTGELRTLREAVAADKIAELKPGAEHAISEVELLLPVPDAEKLLCVGRNYRAHVAEGGHAAPPTFPSMFIRLHNTLVPHGGVLRRPRVSGDFDYEGELAFVIGKGGRHIPIESALEHVFGYSIFNDGSVRDYQFKHSLTAGKNFHATGSCGPWIVTADEIGDPAQLSLQTRLNGTIVQEASTSDLIFDIPALIAYISTFTPLSPGDVVATGTPAGVGFARKLPLWLKAGDEIEIEVSKIGVLRNRVDDEA